METLIILLVFGLVLSFGASIYLIFTLKYMIETSGQPIPNKVSLFKARTAGKTKPKVQDDLKAYTKEKDEKRG